MSNISTDAYLLSEFEKSFQQLDQYLKENDNIPKNVQMIYQKYDEFEISLTKLITQSKKFPGQKKILQKTFFSLLEYYDIYSADEPFLLRILKTLYNCYNSKIKGQSFIINNQNVRKIFLALIKYQLNNQKVFDSANELFNKFFENPNFIHEFVSKNGLLFEFFDDFLYSKFQDDNNIWAITLFQRNLKNKSLQSTDYTDFLQYYSKIDIKTNKYLFLVQFFIQFSEKVNQIKDFSLAANQFGSFEKYIYFTSKLDKTLHYQYLSAFIQDPEINYSYIKSLFNANLAIPEIQNETFNIVSISFFSNQIYRNNRNLLNEVFPLNKVITNFDLPVVRIMKFFIQLNKCHPEMIQLCLKQFMAKLLTYHNEIINDEVIQNSTKKIDLSNPIIFYSKLYEIIYEQMGMKYIDIKQLFQFGFIDIFVILRHPYILAHLFSNYYEKKFLDLILENSKLFLTNEFRNIEKVRKIFKCLLNASTYINDNQVMNLFIQLSSNIIELNPSEYNMETLLNFIIEKKRSNLFHLLLSTISIIPVGKSFINVGGLEKMEICLQNHLISIEKYSVLLSSLVLQQRFDELENYILKLPKDHPLFSIGQKSLEQIAYGMNYGNYKPIRVFSLFHYLPRGTEIDPYNAGMLGKFALDQLIDELQENQTIYDISLIKHIGNRYLLPKHVDLILKSNPYNIQMFTDMSFDHFPLYQFFQSKDELTIQQNYTGISFWFKFNNDFRTLEHFFLNNCIKISIIDGNQFTVSTYNPNNTKMDKIVYKVKINPYKWNFFLMESTEHFMSSTTISIFIDEQKINNDYSQSKTIKSFSFDLQNKCKFTYGKFRHSSSNLLFLGPAIRFFNSQNKNAMHGSNLFSLIRTAKVGFTYPIREASEHYLNSSFDIIYYTKDNVISNIDDEVVYLPTSIHLKENVTCPPTCVCVPYYGFPSHFVSISTISNTFFRLLKESSTSSEFSNILSTIINIDSIIRISSHHFWISLLQIIDELTEVRPHIISNDIFLIIFQQISNLKVHYTNHKILQKILFTKVIWDYIDKPILLQYIFECFKDNDLRSVMPDFEPFLLDLVINNPTCKNLILNILIFHQYVPTVVFHLSKLLILDNVTRYQSDIEIDTKTMSVLFDLKKTIVSSILDYLDDKRVNNVSSYFKFNDLVIYLYTYISNDKQFVEDFACQLLHVILSIISYDPSYLNLKFYRFLIMNLIYLCHNKIIWEDACLLLNGSLDIVPTAKLLNPNSMFILLILMWVCLVIITHAEITSSEKKWADFKFIFGFYNNAIKFCKQNALYIGNSSICLSIFQYMFPIIFTSAYSFSKNRKRSTVNNWLDFYSFDNIDGFEHKSNQDPTLFTKFVGLILNNFKIPFVEITSEQHEINLLVTPILFDFSIFLFELIFQIPNRTDMFNQLFSSVLISSPFTDDEWVKINLLTIGIGFLSLLIQSSNDNYAFLDNFFEYLKFIIAKSPFSDNFIKLTELLLKNDFLTKKYSSHIDEILFRITSRATQDSIKSIYSLFVKYKCKFQKIVLKLNIDNINKTNLEWFCLLHMKGIDNQELHLLTEKERNLFEKNSVDINPNQMDLFSTHCEKFQATLESRYEEMNKNLESKFRKAESEYQNQIYNYYKYSDELLKSINVSKETFAQIQSGYAEEIKQQMEDLDISLFLLNEETKWDHLMIQFQVRQATLANFEPKSKLCPSSQCMPYLYPKLMKPLNYTDNLSNSLDIFISNFSLEKESFQIADNRKLAIEQSEMSFNSDLLHVDVKRTNSEIISSLEVDIMSEKENEFKPTLCTSSKFNLTVNNNKIKNHDVYKCFKSHYEPLYGKIENCFNCVLEIFNLHIPSVLIVFSNSVFAILTFAEYSIGQGKDSNLQFPQIGLINNQTKSNQFKPFIDLVFNQNFANTSIFMSHVIIQIPFIDIIKINPLIQKTENETLLNHGNQAFPCILIWTFSMGHIVLSFAHHDIKAINKSKLINSNLVGFSRNFLPNNFLCKIQSNEEAIKKWNNQLITNEQLLFYLNASSNCSFITSHIFPIFPSVKDHEMSAFWKSMLDILKENQPNIFEINNEEFQLNNIMNITNFLQDRFKLTIVQNKRTRKVISDFDSILYTQFLNTQPMYSLSANVEIDKIVLVKGILLKLSQYEDVLAEDFVIKIIPESMLLQIVEIKISDRSRNFTCVYSKHDPIFYYATHLNASKNGLFVVIDFEFGLSRAYRVIYGNSSCCNICIPKERYHSTLNKVIKPISLIISTEFVNSNTNKSAISSDYLIAASLINSTSIALWNVQSLEMAIGNGMPKEGSAAFVYWASSASIQQIISIYSNQSNSNNQIPSNCHDNSLLLNENNTSSSNQNSMLIKDDNSILINENASLSNDNNSIMRNHVVEMNKDSIVLFQIDENGGIWIATHSKLLFYSFNGEKIAEINITAFNDTEKVEITALEICDSIYDERSAIIGLTNGQLFIVLVRFDLQLIDFKKLQAMHKSAIKSIFINQNRSQFISYDVDGNLSHWSVFGSNDSSINPIHLDKCVVCNQKKAVRSCESCNMGICNDCFSQESLKHTGFMRSQACKCKICCAMDKFLL